MKKASQKLWVLWRKYFIEGMCVKESEKHVVEEITETEKEA